MESDVEERIAELERDGRHVRERMEEICRAFLSEATEFAKIWPEEAVRQAITKHGEHAIALGKDGLRSVKRSLHNVIAQMPELVQTTLDVDQHWAHRCPVDVESRDAYWR